MDNTNNKVHKDIGYSGHGLSDDGYTKIDGRHISNRASMVKSSFAGNIELKGKVGVFGAMLTIVGTIIGGGIVGIPYATLKTGIWLVLGVHALNFVWGIYSIHLLLESKNISGLASFSELGFYWFGRSSIFMINGLVAIAQCGMPIVYFMIVGDIGHSLLSKIHKLNGTFFERNEFSIIVVGALLFIFAIKKEIQELKSAGFVLLAGVILFVIVMLILLITDGINDNFNFADLSKPKFDLDTLANVPTIFLAYGFQSAFFPAYQSLKVKTDANGMKATIASFSFCVTVYIAASIVALLKFGKDLEGNVLVNVGKQSGPLPIIINIVFLLIAMMHIPIVLFVGKEAVLIIYDEITRKSYSNVPRGKIDDAYNLKESIAERHGVDSEGKAYLSMNIVAYYIISILIYGGIVTLACVLKDITLIFGIIGSTAGSYLIFIAPSSFYLRVIQLEEADVEFWRKALAWGFLCLGIIIFGGCMFATIYTAVVK